MARVFGDVAVRQTPVTYDAAGLPLPPPAAPAPPPPGGPIPPPPPPPPTPPPTRPQAQSRPQPRLAPAPAEPELPPPPPPPPIEPIVSVLRHPRVGIAINGERMDAALLVEATVTNNSYFQADSFRVTMAIHARGRYGLAFWDEDEIEVEIFAGFGVETDPDISMIVGRVDDVEFDLDRRQVFLTGRDYTADLIETKTTEKFVNKTSSQIAEEIAGRHGLRAVVSSTRTLVGKYYQIEHARLNDDTTEWNLLTYLAEQERMDVYIQGKELHFEKRPSPSSAQRWIVRYQPLADQTYFPMAPTTRLNLRRSLTIARDIVVKVISHNSKQKKNFEITRRTIRRVRRSGSRGSSQEPVPHVFRIPGLTEEQAIREAERRLSDLTGKQRVVTAELPGDPRVTARTIMVLEGTGTSFDQEYHIDELQRHISQSGGFTMSLTARNLPEDSKAAL